MSADKIMPLSYFNAGGEYTGNIGGMRYLIKKEDDKFIVFVWKGPFRFDASKDEDMSSYCFEFNEAGRESITKKLNDLYEERK